MGLKWRDSRMIGEKLYDLDDESHPLEIRFAALRKQVLDLPGFDDDPELCNENVLEAIQLFWYEEWKEDHDAADDPYQQYTAKPSST